MQILSNKLSSSEAGALAQRERGDLVVSLSLVLPWTDIFGKHFMEKVPIPLLFHEDTMSGNWRLRQWRLYGIIVFGDRREMGHGIREGGQTTFEAARAISRSVLHMSCLHSSPVS